MKKGIFVNYQMAEAINMLNKYKLDNPEEMERAAEELESMKTKWPTRLIPGYGVPIGNAFAGMQELTIEDVKTFADDIMQVDTYSTENTANMQYCLIKGADGKIDFDFTALRQIATLAKANGKKLVIDSAVVFGDRYPENMAHMSEAEVREAISIYIKKLTQEFGDVIERIDVLNSVFQRDDILNREKTQTSEQFWIEKLGEDYASEVLDIARENSVFPDVKLCWNEFYLTNEGMPEKQKAFIERIKSLEGKLDVVGVQDNFRADVTPEYIKASLKTLLEKTKELGIEMSITELGCGVGGNDIKGLGEKDTDGYEKRLGELNGRIKQILDMVIDFAKENDITVETRHSDKYDWNPKYGHEGIQTGLSREQLENLLMEPGKDGKDYTIDVRDMANATKRIQYKAIREVGKKFKIKNHDIGGR